ncbi:HPr kinase/phosphorylase [Affinirhizobium pseudoryzae]|uniref:HPr kinase/phosphorylase n=1 Tax=Allorhizobium pseudoryzae TaxID=379684 RepID=UPI0013EA7E52|nr:HPr kinase/phosphorylase [Allorhizobium pseudoryzae]
MTANNVHGTAIVMGTRGLIFLGPPGAGKSELAFACLAAARLQGVSAALIADDQVFISMENGETIATRPDSIAGLLELRGSGIVRLDSVERAVLHLAIRVIDPTRDERLPPEQERTDLGGFGDLPLIRLSARSIAPLATIGALHAEFKGEPPFS